MHVPNPKQIAEFRETVWVYYARHGRKMPWREDLSPYRVLVSEMMLQQTQVSRVVSKFEAFMYTCPDFASLARQPLGEVLKLWSGLGYNRRAKFLHQTAQVVVRDFGGQLLADRSELEKLPGIGKNTAGAILVYAFNRPEVFVETNIRTVYFHHFFDSEHEPVADKELEKLVATTLDTENPREWYWALMDYGTYLKKTAGGRLPSSRHYVKQAPLKGSQREMRGRIMKALTNGARSRAELFVAVSGDDRFEPALAALLSEELVEQSDGNLCLTGAMQDS